MSMSKKSRIDLPAELGANLEKIHRSLNGDDLPSDPALQEKIFTQASARLQQVISEIAELLAKPNLHAILDGYRLGELHKQVRDDQQVNHERSFGKGAFRNLCRSFGLGVARIKRLLRPVEVFSRSNNHELDGMRMQGGSPLYYPHVELLAEIQDRQARMELLEKTLAENWPFHQVLSAVNRIKKQQRIPGGMRGRQFTPPPNVDALLRQQGRSADHFLNRAMTTWKQPVHSLRSKVQELSQD